MKCNAVQFSDQMVCDCGNVWDVNDPYPPECRNPPESPTPCSRRGRRAMTDQTKTPEQALDTKSVAGILLREFDNVEQAIRYAERMAQRYADSRSLLALEYQAAAEELKAWKQSKHH